MKTTYQNEYGIPEWLTLRKWQAKAIKAFIAYVSSGAARQDDNSFLTQATPGAGKTIVQLALANTLMIKQGVADWTIVCVPSAHLKIQVAEKAKQVFGIDFYHGASGLPDDNWHGEVVTYQQVNANPDLYRARCGARRVFLSADEVHHVGDERAWGNSFRYAFDSASYRLLTSGTPFRSDNQPIPFVKYDLAEDGELVSKADFSYGYGDALADGVCRHVVFPSWDAKCEWLSRGQVRKATFADSLSLEQAAKRRRTCIKADGEWMREVVQDANCRISMIRQCDHVDAAGLIVCLDVVHAQQVAKTLYAMTGEEAVIVTSDDQGASDKIKHFASDSGKNAARWIIAVKMVSEGVDIPRLRVVVFATNVMTPMYFRQIMGRIVRMIGGFEDETAYMYIYEDEELLRLASEVRREYNHCLKLIEDGGNHDDDDADDDSVGGGGGSDTFMPISADGYESKHVWNGNVYESVDLESARAHATDLGLPEAKVVELMKRLGSQLMVQDRPSPSNLLPDCQTKTSRIEKLRSQTRPLVNRLARMVSPDDPDFRAIHNAWRKGCPHSRGQEHAGEQELEQKIEWLKFCIAQERVVRVADFLATTYSR